MFKYKNMIFLNRIHSAASSVAEYVRIWDYLFILFLFYFNCVFLFRKDSDFSSVLYGVILLSRKTVTFILDLWCSSVLFN